MLKLRILLIFLLCAAFGGSSAQADMFGRINYANSFDAAIAYYNLAKLPLDIDQLILTDAGYKKLNLDDKPEKLKDLRIGLNEKFAKFNPATTPLVVYTPVRLAAVENPSSINVTFPTKALPYFPFTALNQTITLFPDGLKNYQFIPIEGRDYLKRISGVITATNGQAKMVLDLIPVAASGKQIMLDQRPQLVVMCDIARIRLVAASSGEILWADINPKYEYVFGIGLRNLFAGSRGGHAAQFRSVPIR